MDCLASPKPIAAEICCGQCRTPFFDPESLGDSDLCPVCEAGQPNFDATYSYGAYEGVLRELIHLYKYGKVDSLSGPLGALVVRALPMDARFEIVLPMPMHWRKKWTRGFNQAELLAHEVAARYGLRPSSYLRRSRYTKPQASLSEADRRSNLKDSFCVHRPEAVRGKRVLLVDDVMTTGATLREAAGVLKAAGVRSVTALTLARVDRSYSTPDNQSLRALDRAVRSRNSAHPDAVAEWEGVR